MNISIVPLLLIIFLYACNENKVVNKPISNKKIQWLLEKNENNIKYLDSLGLTSYANESKWKMYLKYCDALMEMKANKNRNKYFGEANLMLFGEDIVEDSILELYFVPIIEDSLLYKEHYEFKNKDMVYHYYNWHAYNIKNHSFRGYRFENATLLDSTEINDINVSAKKEFIKNNRNILAIWFLKEAIRRKYIQ